MLKRLDTNFSRPFLPPRPSTLMPRMSQPELHYLGVTVMIDRRCAEQALKASDATLRILLAPQVDVQDTVLPTRSLPASCLFMLVQCGFAIVVIAS